MNIEFDEKQDQQGVVKEIKNLIKDETSNLSRALKYKAHFHVMAALAKALNKSSILQTLQPHIPGCELRTVVFSLYYPIKKDGQIYLAGMFNQWDKTQWPMQKKGAKNWYLTTSLYPGLYKYKFFIDSEGGVPKSTASGKKNNLVVCVPEIAPEEYVGVFYFQHKNKKEKTEKINFYLSGEEKQLSKSKNSGMYHYSQVFDKKNEKIRYSFTYGSKKTELSLESSDTVKKQSLIPVSRNHFCFLSSSSQGNSSSVSNDGTNASGSASQSSPVSSPMSSELKSLDAFKRELKALLKEEYRFSIKRSSTDTLLIEFDPESEAKGSPETIQEKLKKLIDSLKSAIAEKDIKENQYEMIDLEEGKLTIKEKKPKVLNRIAELLEHVGRPEKGTSYFQEPLSQVKAALFGSKRSKSMVPPGSEPESTISCLMQ